MKLFLCILSVMLLLASCGSSKKLATTEVKRESMTNLKGEKVVVEEALESGVEKSTCLSEDGTKMIERPFIWFAGRGKADDKQAAIELAQDEAYATISRVLRRSVLDQSKRGNLINNSHLQQAVTQYWEQVSSALLKGCTPFGKTRVEYNPATKMYDVVARIAIRGDRFNELLQTAGDYTKDLTGEELDRFIEINKTIMEAAKGH